MNKKISAVVIFVFTTLLITFVFSSNDAKAYTCLDISSDLSYGMTNNDVLSMQTYLREIGYLTAIPNGHFGPATVLAVKAYQLANKISAVGNVGPQTRASMKLKTCYPAGLPTGSNTTTVGSSGNDTTTTGSSVVNSTPSSNVNPSIVSPKSGDMLTIGDKIIINFAKPADYIHDIILEYPNGSGAGYIASALSGESTYDWTIGRVFDAGTNSYENVATGTYRIRIRKNISSLGTDDPVSGLFTLSAPPISLDSVYPTSAKSDNNMTVALFGKGFDGSTYIRLDGEYGRVMTKIYTSPDNTVILFKIPTNVSAGYHTVVAKNSYGTVSNSLNIFVTK